MKVKEKGKSHPFAGHLNPTEETLWLSIKAPPTLFIRLGLPALSMLGFVVILICIASNRLPLAEQIKAVLLAIGLIVLIGTFVFIPMGIYALLTGRHSAPLPEYAYAVTNERLLYRNKETVSSIPLEHVPSVSLFLGDSNKGTFSFGALFPMWHDVEDAIHVKHLIDEAQEKRTQTLQRL